MGKNSERPVQKNDWARTVRDIGVKAIDSGQFVLFGVFLLIAIAFLKMPGEILGEIIKGVLKNILLYSTSGYILFIVSLVGVGFYIKATNKRHSKQIEDRDSAIKLLKEEMLKIGVKAKGENQ